MARTNGTKITATLTDDDTIMFDGKTYEQKRDTCTWQRVGGAVGFCKYLTSCGATVCNEKPLTTFLNHCYNCGAHVVDGGDAL